MNVSRVNQHAIAKFFVVAVTICTARIPAAGQIRSEQRVLVKNVFDKITIAAKPKVPATLAAKWPPPVNILDVEDDRELLEGVGKYNAFAFRNPENGCAPEVGITLPLLDDVVENDPDRLAFILGHEVAHIVLGHTKCQQRNRPAVLEKAITRDQEYAA